MSSAHSTLKNGKKFGEKPCTEFLSAINKNFQQNWLRKVQFWGFFTVGFYRSFFLSFIAKNGLKFIFFCNKSKSNKNASHRWYITLFPWMMWERISTMGWRQWIQFALGSFSKSVTPLSTHSLLDSSLFLSLSFLWIQLSRTERYCSLAVGQSTQIHCSSGQKSKKDAI